MTKPSRIGLTRLSNEEMFGFCRDVLSKLKECYAETPKWALEFVDAMHAFEEAKAPIADVLPTCTELSELDRIADEAWINLNQFLLLNVQHPILKVREANQRIYDMFSQDENPTRKTYNVEYAVIDRQLKAIRALGTDVIDESGVKPWLDDLAVKAADFNELYHKRINAKSEKLQGAVKEARSEMCLAYQHLIENVTALERLDPSEALKKFIERLNEITDAQLIKLKARRTVKKNQSKSQTDES